MKEQLPTLEVIDKLKALHQHYVRLSHESREKGAAVTATKHSNYASAVANALHEVELMSGMID